MNHRAEIILQNNLDELDRMFEETGAFSEAAAINETSKFAMEVSLEELVTNVIKYGHDDGCAHDITILLERDGDRLGIEIIDDGNQFDPTASPEVDIHQPIEDRPIGGLGLHMVKKMMDSLQYKRVDGKNHLSMSRSLATEGLAGPASA